MQEMQPPALVTPDTDAEQTLRARLQAKIEAALTRARTSREQMTSGGLTRPAFDSLPQKVKNAYARRFGRPKTAQEEVAFAKKVAKRRAAAKRAKVSRRINRKSK